MMSKAKGFMFTCLIIVFIDDAEDGSIGFIGIDHCWIDKMNLYCLIMFDKVYTWMNSKVVPLWSNPSQEDSLWLSYP
jgi:hypothetical protein